MTSKHEVIGDILIEEILAGQYRVGERLPSERDLSQRFDANRGAVREAMKRLEQLGLAHVQPGGARVNPIQSASLDVVGYMLARGEPLPDPALVEQVLDVVEVLVKSAAQTTVRHASDEQLEELRALVLPLTRSELAPEAHAEARIALMRGIMLASGNLILQLIARSLLEQFMPSMEPLRDAAALELDRDSYTRYARELDDALAARDDAAVRAIFDAFSRLNRETLMRAFAAVDTTLRQQRRAAL